MRCLFFLIVTALICNGCNSPKRHVPSFEEFEFSYTNTFEDWELYEHLFHVLIWAQFVPSICGPLLAFGGVLQVNSIAYPNSSELFPVLIPVKY